MSKQERNQIELERKQDRTAVIITIVVMSSWAVLTLICYLTGGV